MLASGLMRLAAKGHGQFVQADTPPAIAMGGPSAGPVKAKDGDHRRLPHKETAWRMSTATVDAGGHVASAAAPANLGATAPSDVNDPTQCPGRVNIC